MPKKIAKSEKRTKQPVELKDEDLVKAQGAGFFKPWNPPFIASPLKSKDRRQS